MEAVILCLGIFRFRSFWSDRGKFFAVNQLVQETLVPRKYQILERSRGLVP